MDIKWATMVFASIILVASEIRKIVTANARRNRGSGNLSNTKERR